MARVLFLASQRRYTGGASEATLEAADFRALTAAIQQRFPGFPDAEIARCSVAIDGEIVGSPLLERLEPDSEVRFLHRLAAG